MFLSLWLGPNKPGDVDSQLLYPIFDKMCVCLPKSVRYYLGCCIDYDKVGGTFILVECSFFL